jgi:hypothetical protein
VNKGAAPGLKKPFSQAMIRGTQVPIDRSEQNTGHQRVLRLTPHPYPTHRRLPPRTDPISHDGASCRPNALLRIWLAGTGIVRDGLSARGMSITIDSSGPTTQGEKS